MGSGCSSNTSHITGTGSEGSVSDQNVWALLRGDPNAKAASKTKVVRIFTSSTFVDTKEERNLLMTKAFPKLKTFCQNLGYEFQVVDMRWGIRNEAEDDHMTTEICLRELRECQQISTGPNFVTFLSQRYGYRPFPRTIEAEEFETVTSEVTEEEQEHLAVWFKKDDNSIPSRYVLQPISSVFPDYLSKNQSAQAKAKDQWWAVFQHLQNILRRGSAKIEDAEVQKKYLMSENEIRQGILNAANPKESCVWFKREIKDLEDTAKNKNDHIAKRFYDGTEENADKFMSELKDKIFESLSSQRVLEYDIQWTQNGVDPDNEEHRTYLEKLSADFVEVLKNLVVKGIEKNRILQSMDFLSDEVSQHAAFCRDKCANFSGRVDLLNKIQSYITGKNDRPLILHGESGSGKTSVMAMAAVRSWTWLPKKIAVMYRFIGTTQVSSSLRPMLYCLNLQLRRLFFTGQQDQSNELKYLVEDFKDLLAVASKSGSFLILLLDSLDQLDRKDGGRQLHWLPRTLPKNVKIILSTLPQEKYGCFPRLKALYPTPSCYIEVPTMVNTAAKDVLKKWLHAAGRTLTPLQFKKLTSAYKLNPLPLYLKLSFDAAKSWHSYDPPEHNALQSTVTETIMAFFEKVERVHGKALVSCALGCLTAGEGLSNSEMEDILSIREDVLDDVYRFWTPPVRRLPPLLWVRVRYDLQEYLVTRGMDGISVIYWYHRQFIETATSRYLANEDETRSYLNTLIEFFEGKWAGEAKPYKSHDGKEKLAARHSAHQPLKFEGGEYNFRKLMRLPIHLIKAGEVTKLKQFCLCNYGFLHAKLDALPLRDVLNDFTSACEAFPSDQELRVVMETLQLSRDGLAVQASELAGQIIGRIHGTQSSPLIRQAHEMMEKGSLGAEAVPTLSMLEAFEAQHQQKLQNLTRLAEEAKETKIPALVPHIGFLSPPGGQLLHKLAEHTDIVVDADITDDGTLVATGSHDNSAKVWTVRNGELLMSVDFPENVGQVRFCHNDKWLVVSVWTKLIYIVDVDTGTILHQGSGAKKRGDHKDMSMLITVCNTGEEEVLVAMRNEHLELWNIIEGKRKQVMDLKLDDWGVHHKGVDVDQRHLLSNMSFYIYAGYRSHQYVVGDMSDMSFTQTVRVFKPYAYDQSSEEEDYAPNDFEHISAMEISGDGTLVIVGNGATGNLHLHHFKTGQQILLVQGNQDAKMTNFFFPPKCDWFYMTHKNLVGVVDLRKGSNLLMLPHPGHIRKVLGIDNNFVITISEDNVLNIWDKNIKPYNQNLSWLSGKVSVSSNAELEKTSAAFKKMLSAVAGSGVSDLPDTRGLLTTEKINNYWTADGDQEHDEANVAVISKFHQFKDNRYVGVTQDNIKPLYTHCFSIWEVVTVNCVRRVYFPAREVTVHTVVNDDNLLISEEGLLKSLSIGTAEITRSFSSCGELKGKRHVLYLPQQNKIVAECSSGVPLKIYHVTDDLEQDLQAPQGQIISLQANQDGTILAANFTNDNIFVWNVDTQDIINSFNMRRLVLPPIDEGTFHMTLTPDGYIIVTVDAQNILWEKTTEKQKQQSCAVIHVTQKKTKQLGNPTVGSARLKSESVSIPIIRNYRYTVLQVIRIQNDHIPTVLHEERCGIYSSSLSLTDKTGKNFITWCPDAKEKTLRYWQQHDGALNCAASFTSDREITDVAVVNRGQSFLLDSPGGLVRLDLQGFSETSPITQSSDFNSIPLFSDIELGLKYQKYKE